MRALPAAIGLPWPWDFVNITI
jgi:hypothetical protein